MRECFGEGCWLYLGPLSLVVSFILQLYQSYSLIRIMLLSLQYKMTGTVWDLITITTLLLLVFCKFKVLIIFSNFITPIFMIMMESNVVNLFLICNRYYCFLVPLTLPVLLVAVYLYWLSMKMFKHAWLLTYSNFPSYCVTNVNETKSTVFFFLWSPKKDKSKLQKLSKSRFILNVWMLQLKSKIIDVYGCSQ